MYITQKLVFFFFFLRQIMLNTRNIDYRCKIRCLVLSKRFYIARHLDDHPALWCQKSLWKSIKKWLRLYQNDPHSIYPYVETSAVCKHAEKSSFRAGNALRDKKILATAVDSDTWDRNKSDIPMLRRISSRCANRGIAVLHALQRSGRINKIKKTVWTEDAGAEPVPNYTVYSS